MARTVTTLTIFVSCPSDLEPERLAIQRVVESVNRSIRGTHDVQFEIWHWKDDAIPGVAATGQDQIDSQIPKHDVFLGMMWKRFGTPTKESGSGTEHELRSSLEAHRSQNEPKYVIFGFKTGIDSLDDLDPAEFGKIATFRKELGDEGILYTTFGATTEFEKLLNINLTKIALSWTKQSLPAGSQQQTQANSHATPDAPNEEEDELGLLDFLEITEDSMADATAEIGRIGDALTGMGSSLVELAEAMSASKGPDGQVPVKLARLLSNQAADDMIRFSKLASPMIRNAESKFEEAIEAMTNALSVQKSFSEGESARGDAENLDNALSQLLGSLDGADDGMNKMRDQVVSLPKLSVRFNRARKEVIGFLGAYSRMSTKVRSLTGNVRQSLKHP